VKSYLHKVKPYLYKEKSYHNKATVKEMATLKDLLMG